MAIRVLICIVLSCLGMSEIVNAQLFNFGKKKEKVSGLTILKNERKKEVMITVSNDHDLEGFVPSDTTLIRNEESYISPSFSGKIVNPSNKQEVYSNSFEKDFILLFAYKGNTRFFEEGVSGPRYFGIASNTNRWIVSGNYKIENISKNEILELIQIPITMQEWNDISLSENVTLNGLGKEGIPVGKSTLKYMRQIYIEIKNIQSEWY